MDDADRARKTAWQAADRQAHRLSVAWNGHLVGWIEDARYDMPHHYGCWVGAGNPISGEFLTALRRAVDAAGGVEVIVGESRRGTVYVHPDDADGEIDVRQDLGPGVMKRLLTVEDTFAITDRGLMVAPMPALHELRGPGEVDVELRLPDGTRRAARLSILPEFFRPAPAIQRWACLFRNLDKSEVPRGTEIWCPADVFVRSLPIAR